MPTVVKFDFTCLKRREQQLFCWNFIRKIPIS